MPATPASDLYALGAMLFECLTGEVPAAARMPDGPGLKGEVLDGRMAAPSLLEEKPLGFFLPEVGAEARLGSLRVGFTVGAAFFPALGPRFTHANTGVNPRCEAAHPTAVGCAPITHLLEGERAFSSFVLWSPQVAMGYVF